MRRLLISTALAVTTLTPAVAADFQDTVPIGSAYDWTGFYAGLFAGGAWGDVDVFDLDGYNITGFSHSYDASGWMAGVHAGYNWQINSFVVGIEGELGYVGLDDEAQFPDYVGIRLPTDSLASIETDFYASLTARLGYAFNNVLVYAKGGVAGLNTEVSFIDTDPTGAVLTSGTTGSEFLVGYTVGGGIEVGLTPNWSLKGEYMFADFDDITHTALDAGGAPWRFTHDLSDVHTVKVGLSYRW